MTKSIKGFFSNQGDVTLRLMIPSGQVSNSPKITYMSTICKFQKHLIKTELVMLMTKPKGGFFQQSRGHNSKTNDLIWPGIELARDFIHVLICKFQGHLIKTIGVMVMTNIFPLQVYGTLLLP